MVKLPLPFHEPVYNFSYENDYIDLDDALKALDYAKKILKNKKDIKIIKRLANIQNDLDFVAHLEHEKYENTRFEDTIESIIWSDFNDDDNEGECPKWSKGKEFHEGVENLNNETEWNMLGKRKDGTYFFLTAAGPWDEGGDIKMYVSKNLDTLIKHGMNSEQRKDYNKNKTYSYIW